MKKYIQISKESFSYEKAVNLLIKGAIITRPSWKGFHMLFMGNYIIYTKEGEIIINPETIEAKDKNDWIVVLPTQEAFEDSYKKLKNLFELSIIKTI